MGPLALLIDGKPQVVFGGGDGVTYAFEPKTGERSEIELNPKDSGTSSAAATRNEITPVIAENKVSLRRLDPEHARASATCGCIDATRRHITRAAASGTRRQGFQPLNVRAVKDGLVYASDLSGFLYCIDLAPERSTGSMTPSRPSGLAVRGGWQGDARR